MTKLDRTHRGGVDVRTALSSQLNVLGSEEVGARSARSRIDDSFLAKWIGGARRSLRRTADRFPARAKVALRPHLIPLRRFMTAPVEEELRQLRVQVDELRQASRIAVPSGDGDVLLRTSVGYVVCGADDFLVLASLLDGGDLERGTRLLIERLLRPGEVFIDIGAHIGLHTIAAGRAMNRSGVIHAFEPYGPSARRLREGALVNRLDSIVNLHEVAASNREGGAELFLGPVSGHHSLFPLGPRASSDAKSVAVNVDSVDHVLTGVDSVDLMKIDVEGAELEVLEGAHRILKSSPEVALIVEFAPSHIHRAAGNVEEWFARFAELGFVYRVIDAESGRLRERSSASLQDVESVNLLFARPEARAWLRAGAI